MGQGASIQHPVKIHSQLKSHLHVLSKIVKLTYDEHKSSIQELNEITSSFNDHQEKQLHFSIVPNTDTTIFWKHTIRIKCEKINMRTNIVESERLLKLRHFMEYYNEITEQVSNLTRTKDSSHASDIFNGPLGGEHIDEVQVCCICMVSKPDVVLFCSHNFCEHCINSWKGESKTCPLCRETIASDDDTWVLTEKPTEFEYEAEVNGYLVGLADRKGSVP